MNPDMVSGRLSKPPVAWQEIAPYSNITEASAPIYKPTGAHSACHVSLLCRLSREPMQVGYGGLHPPCVDQGWEDANAHLDGIAGLLKLGRVGLLDGQLGQQRD